MMMKIKLMGDEVEKLWEGIINKGQVTRTGGSDSARYCYSVWMRHLVYYYGQMERIPGSVIEFGPGDTLGCGIAALLSGAEDYYALDIMDYNLTRKTDAMFRQILKFLRNKEDIPGDIEYPNVYPKLDTYRFPSYILTDEIMEKCLNEERLERIRTALCLFKEGKENKMIHYMVPWDRCSLKGICKKGGGELIFSQAVLEHVQDYKRFYKINREIGAKNCVLSHQIDFSCHGCSNYWNGQYAYGNVLWWLLCLTKSWFINRVTLSEHIKEIKRNLQKAGEGLERKFFSRSFRKMSRSDYETKCIYMQAVKLAEGE